MNSERRHELQQNVLADYLGGVAKKIEPHTKLIAAAFAIGAIAVVGFGIYQSLAVESRSQSTIKLLQNANSGDADALQAVGAQYPDTTAGALAKLYAADANLGEGVMTLYSDRELAEGKIQDALKAYKDVATSAKGRLLISRAYFGMGQALESQGKVKEAIDAYQNVISQKESDAIVKAAQLRIDLLGKPETKEFLTWFAKQDFKPADPAMPPNLPDGKQLPDLPDLDLPEVTPLAVPSELKAGDDSETKPAPGTMTLPETEAAATETTATETAPAAETTPAEPATEAEPSAAEAETPATKTPATETPAAEAPVTEVAPDKADEPVAGDEE